MRISSFACVLVLSSAAVAAAQPPGGGQPQPAPSNLQILPKDTPRPQVIQIMQTYTAALGVECSHCHVQEGRGGRNDMAADDKPTKKTARQMMQLTREINDKLPALVGKAAGTATTVACATCHRGVAIPKQLSDVVIEAAATGGAPTGLARFKELREKYYGGQSYDFSEGGLIAIARRAQAAGNPDDALAYLQANLEYFPKSSRTYQAMSQIKNAKGDTAGAISDLEKAVELDPANAQAKAQLQQLKGQ